VLAGFNIDARFHFAAAACSQLMVRLFIGHSAIVLIDGYILLELFNNSTPETVMFLGHFLLSNRELREATFELYPVACARLRLMINRLQVLYSACSLSALLFILNLLALAQVAIVALASIFAIIIDEVSVILPRHAEVGIDVELVPVHTEMFER
jgi:hypothetical protein